MKHSEYSGLHRQDQFLSTVAESGFDYGLVLTQAFLKGIRDIGYKSTATALFESIDNSLQAEADKIHIMFDFEKGKSTKKDPDRIAIVDNGHGMSKDMIRIAVLWGGSDRLDDRKGMGKYGYGLPSSCVSIGRKFTVISKRPDMKEWCSVSIDIEEIAERDSKYIDPNTGRIIAPEAVQSNVPSFVEEYLKKLGQNLEYGTIIIIEKIDRLSKINFGKLKSMLFMETGITYRNFTRQADIYIQGEIVQPIDPLFLSESHRWYDENDLRAEQLPQLDLKLKNSMNDQKVGTVRVRFSYMPFGFFKGQTTTDDLNLDEIEQDNELDMDIDQHHHRKDKSKRLTVRKENNGIIFLRNGRQIDVVDSKVPWFKVQNDDRHIGVEVDFTPELDEEFSITTSKQQIVVSTRIWNQLKDHGVLSAIKDMQKRFQKERDEYKDRKKKETLPPEKSDTLTETMMEKSAKKFEVDKSALPHHARQEGQENLEKKAKELATETGLPEQIIKQELESKIEKKPFSIDYFDDEEKPFYTVKQFGSQIIISFNKAHRFYKDLYNNEATTPYMKSALALLIFVLGHSELRVSEERAKVYKQERIAWSSKLDSTLEVLADYFAQDSNDKIFDE